MCGYTKIWLGIVWCFFVSIHYLEAHNPEAAKQLVALRRAQQQVLYNDYMKIEKIINELKCEQEEAALSLISEQGLQKNFLKLQKSFPRYMWQLLFLISWITIAALLSLSRKRQLYYALLFPCCMGLLLSLGCLLPDYLSALEQKAVVNSDLLDVRLAADQKAIINNTLKYLEEVNVVEEHDNWCKIIHDGTRGWVKKDALEMIN
jgi:hypothetical protein